MQVAAADPRVVGREELAAEVIAAEREIYLNQAKLEGKPEKILDKIVDGRLEKFYSEACLLEQPFVKDTDRTVKDLITAVIARTGENIKIRRFVRFRLGE
jgi:elongation factor Ts